MSSGLPVALALDPAVPQRDFLLDPDGVARRLASTLGANGPMSIESCRRTFVSYRVGKRLRVAYRVRIDGNDHHVAASTFRSENRSARAYRNVTNGGRHSHPLRHAVHDTELDTVFWTFPNDRRIGSLADLAEPSPDLTRALGHSWTRSCLVDYYPEVSAVVRCLDDSNAPLAYAKVHAGDEGERTYRAQDALVRAARGSRLRLARPLAYSAEHHTLLVEPVAGRAIGALQGPDLATGLHAYGAALAALHCLPLEDVPPPPRPPLDRLHRKARGIGEVRPDVRTPSVRLLGELSDRWDDGAGEPVAVHGDTNLNNAILVDGRVAFIDFDRAAIGSAGSDIGNFLALLKYLRVLGVLSPAAEMQRATTFMNGYSSVRDLPDPSYLRTHISAALAERAFRAVNRLRPRALPKIPTLLAEAEELLSRRGGSL